MLSRIIESLLTGNRLASWVRHVLTTASGLLVGYQLASVEEASNLAVALSNIIAEPEIWTAVLLYVTGQGGSVANKKAK